ncbi:VOC family protein [Glaciimonas immobilis]|uniref:Catechol 2,3-dioxygenase-like lactoylglutathione lyase family enzyme n=1 Tax=Glaciimonas immobilis TaxID=728004 RepID=A0A840RRE1_9BURK|nr:VOC family protein [Glaciimonas immobilis]KAF3999517.1 VOC family protein [Glaciimonas immobilis]MBB5199049.1 catechol 2,3-dioxygenase-like lactoylglutathione lyase family enzyme [Glaciimonas immobilis]
MLDHVSVTVTDLARAEEFYDAVFLALGVCKVGTDFENGWIGYGERADEHRPDLTYFSIRLGLQPDDATRRHWCFKASSRKEVDAFWRNGILKGGICNGQPGLHDYHRSYYAAFLRDPEGNRIEAVCHKAED